MIDGSQVKFKLHTDPNWYFGTVINARKMWVERSDGFVADEASISEWARLKAFDIGWIPSGWTKGENLKIVTLNWLPVIAHIMQDIDPYGEIPSNASSFALQVLIDQNEKATAWLEWWRLTEPKT